MLLVAVTATIFSLLGFINAVFARNFDDISIIPTFIRFMRKPKSSACRYSMPMRPYTASRARAGG